MELGAGPPLRSKRDTLFVNKDAGKISPWKLLLSALVGAGIVSAALYFLGGSADSPTVAKAPVPVDAAVVAVAPPDAAEAIAPPIDAMDLEEIEFDVPTGPDPKTKDPKDPKKPKPPKRSAIRRRKT